MLLLLAGSPAHAVPAGDLDYLKLAQNDHARYEEVLQTSDRKLDNNTYDAAAWTGKGARFYFLGKYKDSVAACDQAITCNPEFAKVWNTTGKALLFLERYREAVEAVDQAVLLDPKLVINVKKTVNSHSVKVNKNHF